MSNMGWGSILLKIPSLQFIFMQLIYEYIWLRFRSAVVVSLKNIGPIIRRRDIATQTPIFCGCKLDSTKL
jgi:hypothetical protein